MSTTPEPVDIRSSEVTYMGRRQLSTGKIGYAYTGEDGSPRYYKAALVTGAQIGQASSWKARSTSPTSTTRRGREPPASPGSMRRSTGTLSPGGRSPIARSTKPRPTRMRATGQRSKLPTWSNHIEALIAAARNLSGPQRAAFARYVEDRIRGW